MGHKNRLLARIANPGIWMAVVGLSVGCQADSSNITEIVPEPLVEATKTISAATLRNHVERLSADEMEGRSPGTQGALLARRYLAEDMSEAGLHPAFQGGWEQAFELVSITTETPQSWRFSADDNSLDLEFWDDFVATSGIQAESATIDDAGLFFVGYGIQAPEFDWDDFKGVDLQGKVLLMLNDDPDWDDDLFAGKTRLYYGRWDYKYESAARQGAVGAIIIHTTPSAGYPWQVLQSTGPDFELPAGDEPRLQISSWVTEDAARQITKLAGQSLDELVEAAKSPEFRPVDLSVTTSLALTNTLEVVEGANVGGLLEGSDPQLESELVVYSAHYDHLGIGEENEEGDRIFNGARDNASGSAAVLAIAEAFAALPTAPARSLLFLFVDGEEQGLLGSEFFARNPIVLPGKIAANLNIDGANIWGLTRDIGSVGYGKSSLDAVVEQAAARQGRVVKPEHSPDKGYFYRSDQFNFAKIGVPAIYLDEGTDFIDRPEGWGEQEIERWVDTHYHQRTDEVDDSWNFDGFVEDTLLMFEAGMTIANRPEMPTWNHGDEFEAARLEALTAID